MRSYLINDTFWGAYCGRIFGAGFEYGPNVTATNEYYGGLEITGSNIYFANADEDPW